MKRVSLLIVLVLSFSLVGCTSNAASPKDQSIDQLVTVLRSKLHNKYGEKIGINIFVRDLPKKKAERISNDMCKKLKYKTPKREEFVDNMYVYTCYGKDKLMSAQTFYKAK